MEELLLMNPKGKGSRDFQIVFPKKVKKLRANEGSVEKRKQKKLPLIGASEKQLGGAVIGAGATIAVPTLMKLKGWADVAASGGIAVVGGGALRGMDKSAGEAFLYTGLGITGLKTIRELIKTARGEKTSRRRRRTTKRSLGDEYDMDEDLDTLLGNVDDLSDDEFDELLDDINGIGDEYDDGLLGVLNEGIGDLEQITAEFTDEKRGTL
ncbi:MAG: hypothetical protein M8353_03230 [ANME-2 cluster archaeon]|nr:hypothetical protein [ANME-2 cluster archaeon]